MTITGIQLAVSWNYHRSYVGLHREFYQSMEGIVNKRLELFRDALKTWLASMFGQVFDSMEQHGKLDEIGKKIVLKLGDLSLNPKSEKEVEKLYNLMSKAEEPMTKYKEARDACKSLYKWLLVSGLLTLLGLIPQIPEDSQFGVLYFIFLIPLMAAAFSWDTFSTAEDELIKLRDEGA